MNDLEDVIWNLDSIKRNGGGPLSVPKSLLILAEHIRAQDRQIKILMELVNEQRDTIQLIKYDFED
ncbi:MAG: hypothetical protein V4708_16935 [Bacteroidota bacterium]